MDRWKAEMGRVREEKRRRKKIKEEKLRRKNSRKVAKHGVFPIICGSGGSKSRVAKAAGAEPSGQMRDEALHAVVACSAFRSQMYKTQQRRTTFGSWDVEKVHAVVARSTFPSQTVQSTPASEQIWKLRCRKSARRCGAKHISKQLRALISWERLHFGASDLQVCWDHFAWQVQHFVWLGSACTWQAQHFRHVDWKNRKTHWHEAISSALNFPFLKDVSQNCFVFDVVNLKNWGSLVE